MLAPSRQHRHGPLVMIASEEVVVDYRSLGRTGLKVSELCLGTMQFGWTADEAGSGQVLTKAFESGINFIDTADVYSRWVEGNPGGVAESIIGRWLRQTGIDRTQVVIATKVRGRMGEGPNAEGLSRVHILHAVEESLRRLQTDYIDLYQVHAPDPLTPIDETLSALDSLVKRGLIRYVGCSNFEAWRLMQALWVADKNGLTPFVSLQPHYNLIHRQEYERELEQVCTTYGLGVIPYSPLAGGFLTGKYLRGEAPPAGSRGSTSTRIQGLMHDDRPWQVLDALSKVGRAQGKSASQVALAWLVARPGVTSPIIGPKNLDQLQDNLGAVGFALGEGESAHIEQACAGEGG